MPTNVELAEQMSDLFDRWQSYMAEQRALLAGTADGGPGGNGYYPVTDPTGVVTLVPCTARLRLELAAFTVGSLTGAGPHTIGETQTGKYLTIGNGSSTSTISVVLLRTAPVGMCVIFEQVGSGALLFSTQNAAGSIRQRQSYRRTAGIGAVVTAVCTGNSAGNNAAWNLAGDMIA